MGRARPGDAHLGRHHRRAARRGREDRQARPRPARPRRLARPGPRRQSPRRPARSPPPGVLRRPARRLCRVGPRRATRSRDGRRGRRGRRDRRGAGLRASPAGSRGRRAVRGAVEERRRPAAGHLHLRRGPRRARPHPRYQGAGSSQIVPTRLDDALTEMRALAGADLPFAPGYRLDHGEPDEALVEQAREVAAAAQVAVVFLGLPEGEESEGYDRAHLDLPAGQRAMLDAVIATGTTTVVVLSNGGVVAVSGWDARVAAILEGWLLGQAGGGALADLLYGVANPSGRLAETIPLRLEDTPSFLNFPGDPDQVRYGEGVFVGYRYHDAVRGEVAYPFGHGLSYTTFAYSDLTVSVKGADEEIEVEVAARVTNTGGRQGREVAQLYVSAPSATVGRPVRELRGFTKVALEPGESAVVRFGLGYRDFSYFDVREGRWAAEPGTASVHVGASSRDLRLHAEVTLDVAGRRPPLTPDSPLGDWFADDAGRTALLGVAREPSRFLSEEYARTLGSIPLSRLARFPGSKIDPDSLEELAARVRDDRP
ncbi:glycoside hydrolase family 3 C-terminal domain-containing protein [Nonomuraea recticatena]|uniref:glycoside hydrolase family 3 C-terminal domain-containing protein n=1 Tax=Nonomuraea recticatena TaxID=46178 RepID=UPI00360BE03B